MSDSPVQSSFPERGSLNLPDVASEILKRWERENTFQRSIDSRPEDRPYVFFEGPPSANGKPGIHHVMARAIKAFGIKMVLSGEGADELFGGYLYFHKAPTAKDFHDETIRKLDKLHQYDCLRANKSLASWGIEGRVPFLDKEFMDVAMRINPKDKMITPDRMEKWVIRKAFEQYLPESVAWRQKEQFSDGVGYDWIDTLKEVVEKNVSDEQMQNAHFKFPVQTPQNKEEFYYRSIFEEHFPSETAALSVPSVPSVACSTPIALEWDEAFKNMNDPSGRAVAKVHDDAY